MAAFLLSAHGLTAQENGADVLAQPVQSIEDGGTVRAFEVAHDEVFTTEPDGRRQLRRIKGSKSAKDARKVAEELEKAQGEEASLVLYEKGKPRTAASRRLLTTGVLVTLSPGASAAEIARQAGAAIAAAPSYAPGQIVLDSGKPGAALAMATRIRTMPGVDSAEPLLARKHSKRLVPTDPLFASQWHLRNTGQTGGTAGVDINPLAVWDTVRGTGVRIGIVDDGLQTSHPDLAPNVDTANDYDWNGGDNDPSPDLNYDFHGTSCAGVAAARANNATGGSGAAPQATLVGLRLISDYASDQQEADALNYRRDIIQIKSNSWGPSDDGRTLEGPGDLAKAALRNACETGRGGLGTIFTWAGGNGGNSLDDSNKDGYANSIYTIAVGAVSDRGTKADYSEPGANLVVVAPSSSSGRAGITTTDLVGSSGYNTSGRSPEPSDRNYTSTFGGTSSSTPLVSGVIALMLEANPNLGWRDVQEILMRSATKCSPSDTDWIANAAGFNFNHKFGAGLVNAGAAVQLARGWSPLGLQTTRTSLQTGLAVTVPDNNSAGVTRTFTMPEGVRVEHATVTVDILHANRGDLEISLRSPSGTVSRLIGRHNDTGDNYSTWTFMTVRNWGESSAGLWTLTVKDLRSGNVGTLRAANLTLFGSGGAQPPPPTPTPTPSPTPTPQPTPSPTPQPTPTPPPSGTTTFSAGGLPRAIPDNSTTGITSVIDVTSSGTVSALSVSANISHPFRGDLRVTLISPTGASFILHNRTGSSTDNVVLTGVPVTAFNGLAAAGQWRLLVQDLAAADTGTLNSWSLTITASGSGTVFSAGALPRAIPDNSTTGTTSVINVTSSGTVSALSVSANISHPFRGDLRVTLISPTGASFILHNRTGTSTDNVVLDSLPLTAFNGLAAAGQWRLLVQDLAAADTGTLNSWSLRVATGP